MSTRLESASSGIAPIYGGGLDRTHPEDQLMDAFHEARIALRRDIPEDAVYDVNESSLSSEVVENQIRLRENVYAPAMESRTDTDVDQGLQLTGLQCQQYYLNKFFSASQGIGAYPAMLGRQAIDAGAVTEQEYIAGIEGRLRRFSEIIFAAKIGQLKPLVNPASMGGDSLIVSSDGTKAVSSNGTSGLGVIQVPVLIAVTIVACVLIGGITYSYIRRNEVNRSAQLMTSFCQDAMKLGNEKAIKHCAEGAGVEQGGLLKEILGDKGTSELVRILGFGALGVALIYLAPSLKKSLMDAQEVGEEREKEKRLARSISSGIVGGTR